MIPLAEAWDSGASGWIADRRKRFANDLDVSWSLIVVSASSNRSKGDQDPADWLPPAAGELCSYLGDWLAVRMRWSLSVMNSGGVTEGTSSGMSMSVQKPTPVNSR